MVTSDFKAQLEQIVSDVGFSSVGITNPTKIDTLIKERFVNFIKNDWHAGMCWLEKRIDQRVAPQKLWPSVKSVLVFTDDYTPVENPLKKLSDKEMANFSVYVSEKDYHKVVKSKLKVVASWVKKKLDCDLKIFVDTAPVIEKTLGQLSGLGWQGKHTNLVSRKTGNWFFIGVMYIDKPLPVDEPESDNCGTCRKCLDVCPTNAFKGEYKLDARKCIAYLTIEHKGAVDVKLRSSIGNRVFGCDDCLAVCPWNKFAKITRNVNYRNTFSDLTLERAISFTDTEFRNFFSGTAVKRLGSTRFLRNVIYAMGNSGNKRYIKLLEKFLSHSVDFISEAANWSISELKKNE
jgi:epoxyqueuosine reductase